MRRPRFYRWIRSEVLRIAGTRVFNLRSLAARAQQPGQKKLAAAIMLFAHENECLERLYALVYDQSLLQEYQRVESHLGPRSIERLALRGSPMLQLPQEYRRCLEAYERAFHAPERIADDKDRLRNSSAGYMLKLGLSPTKIAHILGLDAGNTHAYLVRGEVERFTLETAHDIDEYLSSQAARLYGSA